MSKAKSEKEIDEKEEIVDQIVQNENKDIEEIPDEIKELRNQLEAEKAGRTAAENARREAEAEAKKHRESAGTNEETAIQAQITALARSLEATDSNIVSLKNQYSTALRDGDFDKAADLQAEMGEESARKLALTNGKTQLENYAKERKENVERENTQRTIQTERTPSFDEAIVRYTPRTQEWIRRHPEVLQDTSKMNFAQSAHFSAVASGYIVDTDAYFDHLDEMMGYKKTASSKPTPGNPPSRSSTGNGSVKELKVNDMTPRMLQLAKEADVKPEEWIANYNKLLKEDPTFTPIH